MAEEERFSREKRAKDCAPVQALSWCLREAGIALRDVSTVALGWDFDRLAAWHGCSAQQRQRRFFHDRRDYLFPESAFGPGPQPPVKSLSHHLSHAASAYYPSGFRDAAILVCDMRGEDASTLLAHGSGDGITVLETHGIERSLGLFYRAATKYAGLWRSGGEAGKLMGLAPYGKPRHRMPLAVDDGRPSLTGIEPTAVSNNDLVGELTQQLLEIFVREAFPHEAGLAEEVMAYADFAASAQRALDEAVVALARHLRDLTRSPRLCLAGGVALNCTTNGELARSGLFAEMFVAPAAHDAGVAIGAALIAAGGSRSTGPHFVMDHAYWGPHFDHGDAIAAALRRGLTHEVLTEDALIVTVAETLAAGGIVGWFQGRAEIGPRALGARSLLATPATRRTLIRVNRMKGREMWRPLAPSIRAERFSEFFDGVASPFMNIAAQVRLEKRSLVPAVVHVDGSARPQAVTKRANPRYWKLLLAFEALTGLPIVVNTSFNVAGRPIVGTPDHAVEDFLAMGVDALAIGTVLIRAPGMRSPTGP